jgi:cysteinyl-tRNA synthetase
MVLKVFNTLTGKKEVFKPLQGGKVGIYVCGPTVYDHSHVGHARTYVAFDVIHRWLEYKGFKVKWVMNITDVDDKTIKRAKKEKLSLFEVVTKFTQSFFRDMEALQIYPDIYPNAIGHMPEMIELIRKLLQRGYAYEIKDGVYYDVSKFEEYGKLSKQRREELVKHRVEPNPRKRNPGDFALWKKKKLGEPSWQSPWGPGRPGWHIECSAMSSKYLGKQFDIHGGGSDLIFPHHENEIAQSEAAWGKKPWVRYWLHTGFLNIRGEKMSKSLGNIILISEALKKWDPETLRLFFVSKHYRSPIDFREEFLAETKESLQRLRTALELLGELRKRKAKKLSNEEKSLEKRLRETIKEFERAMNDDFNTPKALAVVFNFVREINKFVEKNQSIQKELHEKISKFFQDFGYIFGILRERKVIKIELLQKLLAVIIEMREKLRREKQFKLSDEIRKRLAEVGIVLEDTPQGARWRIR